MKNLISFLKTSKGLWVLALIAVAAPAYYYTIHVNNSKDESTPVGHTSETEKTTPTVSSPEAIDKAVLPVTIENELPGSTNSTTDPVDGKEIHLENSDDEDGVNPTSKFDDPTSYYEPTVTGIDRAVWAAANRAAPRCENFRSHVRKAILVSVN
jgi:hypothetical protein